MTWNGNMKFREYFDVELRTAVINIVAGGLMGYVSFVIDRPLMAAFMAVVAVALLSLLLNNITKEKKSKKWWISNGVLIFLLTWFVVWTVFYDIRLLSTLPR